MEVKIYIDKREVDLNDFAKKIIGGIITGAISSLRGVNQGWKKIRIDIDR